MATALFVAAVPVFLIASNARWVINVPLLYSYGFDKYNVTTRTGMERSELLSAARQIRDYFNNDEEYLNVRVVRRGIVYESLYNPPLYSADEGAGYSREVRHMKDVKWLVKGVYRVQEATGLYLALFAIVGVAAWRRRFVPHLARAVALSGAGARFALTLTSWPSIQAKSAGRLHIWMFEPALLPASAVTSVPPRLNTVPSGT